MTPTPPIKPRETLRYAVTLSTPSDTSSVFVSIASLYLLGLGLDASDITKWCATKSELPLAEQNLITQTQITCMD